MARKVSGLVWARRLEARPAGIPKSRPKGAKAQGLKFEKALAKTLTGAEAGVWWEFEDVNGKGHCQTDLVIIGHSAVLVLEAKLSATDVAWAQLEELYLPVLGKALGLPVFGCQIASRLWGKQSPGVMVVKTLPEALAMAKLGFRPLVHWAGLGPLM